MSELDAKYRVSEQASAAMRVCRPASALGAGARLGAAGTPEPVGLYCVPEAAPAPPARPQAST